MLAVLMILATPVYSEQPVARPDGTISEPSVDDWDDAELAEGAMEQKKPSIFEEWMGSLFQKVSPENLTQVDEQKQRRAEEALGFNR